MQLNIELSLCDYDNCSMFNSYRSHFRLHFSHFYSPVDLAIYLAINYDCLVIQLDMMRYVQTDKLIQLSPRQENITPYYLYLI